MYLTFIKKKPNPFDISVPYIKIAKCEMLFEQYKMTLNWDKNHIEVQNDDAIKLNRTFFDFMQQIFNPLDGIYLRVNFILIDTIMQDQLRKQIAA